MGPDQTAPRVVIGSLRITHVIHYGSLLCNNTCRYIYASSQGLFSLINITFS